MSRSVAFFIAFDSYGCCFKPPVDSQFVKSLLCKRESLLSEL